MKDYPNLLAAAAHHAHEQTDAHFVCLGHGPANYVEDLKTYARSLGLANRLIWAAASGDVRSAYNAFDIATLPSAFGEGFPNVVGEALACGIPVVATDVGDVRTIVGRFGEIVPPRSPEALAAGWTRLRQRLEREPDLRSGARSSIVVGYSVNAMVDRTELALVQLCSGRPAEMIVQDLA
jgi:glycosyltransferase involved in cell wall biosynthesis